MKKSENNGERASTAGSLKWKENENYEMKMKAKDRAKMAEKNVLNQALPAEFCAASLMWSSIASNLSLQFRCCLGYQREAR